MFNEPPMEFEKGEARDSLKALSDEITQLVEKVSNGVASVITTRIAMDTLLRLIPVKGVGSAFVISENGYLVTNSHVVARAKILTLLLGNRQLSAEIISTDPSRDIALLRTSERGLVPLKLGDSDKVKVGELVLAIGSPLGLPGPNVSLGVVSATGRTIEGKGFILEDLIQTDAAINPGNSGGPLLNMRGEVIGVTTAMIPYAQGVGFAIPINTVKRFIDMVSKYGKPLRAWIGIVTVPLNEQLARYYGLMVNEGLLVIRILRESPAHIYGVREGDIITHAEQIKLKTASDLRRVIEELIDRQEIKLTILRGQRRMELRIPMIIEEVS